MEEIPDLTPSARPFNVPLLPITRHASQLRESIEYMFSMDFNSFYNYNIHGRVEKRTYQPRPLCFLALEKVGTRVYDLASKMCTPASIMRKEWVAAMYKHIEGYIINATPSTLVDEITRVSLEALQKFVSTGVGEHNFSDLEVKVIGSRLSMLIHPSASDIAMAEHLARYLMGNVNLCNLKVIRCSLRNMQADVAHSFFKQMTKLTDVYISFGATDDLLEILISNCKQLKHINVENSPLVTDTSCTLLQTHLTLCKEQASQVCLEQLVMLRTGISSEGVSLLLKGMSDVALNLKELKIDNVLSQSHLDTISSAFPTLEVLSIGVAQNVSVSELGRLKKLAMLGLDNIYDWRELSALLRSIAQQLHYLKLSHCQIDPTVFSQCHTLNELVLENITFSELINRPQVMVQYPTVAKHLTLTLRKLLHALSLLIQCRSSAVTLKLIVSGQLSVREFVFGMYICGPYPSLKTLTLDFVNYKLPECACSTDQMSEFLELKAEDLAHFSEEQKRRFEERKAAIADFASTQEQVYRLIALMFVYHKELYSVHLVLSPIQLNLELHNRHKNLFPSRELTYECVGSSTP